MRRARHIRHTSSLCRRPFTHHKHSLGTHYGPGALLHTSLKWHCLIFLSSMWEISSVFMKEITEGPTGKATCPSSHGC